MSFAAKAKYVHRLKLVQYPNITAFQLRYQTETDTLLLAVSLTPRQLSPISTTGFSLCVFQMHLTVTLMLCFYVCVVVFLQAGECFWGLHCKSACRWSMLYQTPPICPKPTCCKKPSLCQFPILSLFFSGSFFFLCVGNSLASTASQTPASLHLLLHPVTITWNRTVPK